MHANKIWMIVTVAVVGMVGSAAVFAQMGGMMNSHQHQATTATPSNTDQSPMQKGMHMMMQGRQMMMQARQQQCKAMSEQMQQQKTQLEEAVTAMKAAQGDQRIDAIQKVVELLAQQREMMYDHMQNMQQMMGDSMMDGCMMGHGTKSPGMMNDGNMMQDHQNQGAGMMGQ